MLLGNFEAASMFDTCIPLLATNKITCRHCRPIARPTDALLLGLNDVENSDVISLFLLTELRTSAQVQACAARIHFIASALLV